MFNSISIQTPNGSTPFVSKQFAVKYLRRFDKSLLEQTIVSDKWSDHWMEATEWLAKFEGVKVS